MDSSGEERRGRRASVHFETDANPPADLQHQTPEKACRFSFNNEREKWCKSSCKVHFNETPLSTTQKSATYKMVDALTGEEKICTLFPPNTPEETYFDDAMIQHLAQEYALLFNEISEYPVKFVPKDVYKLSERQNFLVSVHPKLCGEFAPNEEMVLTEAEQDIMEAFSHFSWEASHGNLVITSMSGYGGVYTSARIHSVEQQWLKDRGTEGIVRFFKKHTCNQYCKMHKFRPFKMPEQFKEAPAPVVAERKAESVKPPPLAPEEKSKAEAPRHMSSWIEKMDQPPPLIEQGADKSPVNTSSRPVKVPLIPDSPETHALKTDSTLQDLNSLTKGMRNQLGVKPPKMQQEQPGSKSPKYSGLLVSKGVPGGVLKITKAGMKSMDRERKHSPLRRQI
ncbi:hypothetical protein GUITHDRAFT_120723 [Guillardia theta CCMP2712]|uniref:Alpha-type protein kinase domain-containing protein n=1 Tax=Guillardia theta (strain CCMP2712) TaxID=905079 RepID=L1IB14_GUITC|nr:hypothetical protein GUITHDRAFT_120723 [Guillardia theta CCMP2712]EKX33109.1 hypothetical protein GUITHDRAFT_120723 [Guillardia theta CCMP2712]|eukprot:XP_005820089.1 hypothetical protein GUITHDRAFT_120723 [Guillardia theta CCMP2712]